MNRYFQIRPAKVTPLLVNTQPSRTNQEHLPGIPHVRRFIVLSLVLTMGMLLGIYICIHVLYGVVMAW